MIQEFKSEFARIATIVGAEFQVLEGSELEDFAQDFDFAIPLINFVPINRFTSNIGDAGQMIYDGNIQIQFLTKAATDDKLENVKDVLIDDMIELSTNFYLRLNKNDLQVFGAPQWDFDNTILRFKSSNYLVGVQSNVTFNTSCNRVV